MRFLQRMASWLRLLAGQKAPRVSMILSWDFIVDTNTEIRRCREHAWQVVTSRRHDVVKAFTHDRNAMELMMIGRVHMGLVNGNDVSQDFTAQVVLSRTQNGELRIKSYQVWAVCDH
jgi:hypothetical protein